MYETGKDMLPVWQIYQDEAERLKRGLPRYADLTLIFNRHADAEDAEKSVAPIEPGSLVFIEGFESEERVDDRESVIDYLRMVRLTYGKEHTRYLNLKNGILERKDHIFDISEHMSRQVLRLIEKDCVVCYADFRPFELDSPGVIFNDIMKVGAEEALGASVVSKIWDKEVTIAKAIAALYQRERRVSRLHALREVSAQLAIYRFFDALRYARVNDLSISESDRVKTYMIYGTAHQDSLSKVFEDAGFSPKKIILDATSEGNRQPTSPEAFRNNIRRLLAFRALQAISYESMGSVDKQNELYDGLAPLNDNQDDALQFLIRCVQTAREYNESPERADQWLDELYRDAYTMGK